MPASKIRAGGSPQYHYSQVKSETNCYCHQKS